MTFTTTLPIDSMADDNAAMSSASTAKLTTAQQMLWLGQKLAPDSPLYNMAFLFTLSGEINPAHFQSAFDALVRSCDALRIVIEEQDGMPCQRAVDLVDALVPVLDFSDRTQPHSAVRSWAKAQSQTLFTLSEKLFDTALIRLAPDCFVWYLNQHHLITDVEALRLLVQRMGDFYQWAVEGALDERLAEASFPEYIQIATRTQPTVSKRATKYWQQQIEQVPGSVALYQRMADSVSARTRRVSCELGVERTAALTQLAMDAESAALTPRLSLFNLVAGLLLAYLYRVSGQAQVAIATPAHGRLSAEVKETVGLFVELFPLLGEAAPDETFGALLAKVSESAGKLLRYAQPGASELAAHPEVNVVLNFIHAEFSDFAGHEMCSEWIHADAGDPRHHLRLQVHDLDCTGSLQLHFDFNEDLFDRALQERAPGHFLALVDAVLADRTQRISGVDLLGDAERSHLITLGTSEHHEPSGTVVDRFEATVRERPSAVAVRCESQTLTYQQLNERANRLADYLRSQGVTTNSPVGICLRRSPDLLVAVLAVLKAGGTYVPIEPAHPTQRIAYILQDTQVQWVLTQSSLCDRFAEQTTLIVLDRVDLSEAPAHNLAPSPVSTQLAYLLYTSGSTGQPKGVAIAHKSLLNYVQWAIGKYVRGRSLSFPLFSPLAFDLTVTSIFVPLLSGGQVVVYPEGDQPIDLSLQRIFQENAVDVIKLTPSHLALVQGMSVGDRVKTLILGGEDLRSALAAEIAAACEQPLEIYNEYGPTEATVGCMIHQFDTAETAASVPIGQPAAGAEIYLLDESFNLVPQGGVGEIFIGGPGLAQGYFNRDALTAERFVTWQGKRLYRTGDLGRWRADGCLTYLGRSDRQVKIHGHRVELGEIEAAVAAHPQVSASAVRVVQPAAGLSSGLSRMSLSYCKRCGLASNYPGVGFDEAGVCDVCRTYETYKHRAAQYFRTMGELRSRLEAARARKKSVYDCMMLLSGGKDSTYALAQLVHMGFKVFAFTLDNGYISDSAKENISRVVQALKVDHVFDTTPAMNEIFVDSLERHCNVCNGCFKTIYTLSMKMAYKMGISAIVTGLSRGQFFETRLSEEWFTELFGQPEFNPDTIDETVLAARKVYHRSDDAVSQLMDVSVFASDDIFEAVEIVDFYRYCDVELTEMLAFLRDRLPWIRPADTGRSTNCLINNAGIYVHQQQRGYHNYALPYSWDVRMGHKTVEACIDELNDEIDVGDVKQILEEIGFDVQRSTEAQLAAYYCLSDESGELLTAELRAFLAQRLPSTLVPTYFVPLSEMPLTANGKVDFAALPDAQASRPDLTSTFVAPQTDVEKRLAKLWQQVLKVESIGIYDNFFDLGGDSIMAIQIAARLSEAGFVLSPNQIFQQSTIAELAAVVVPEGAIAPVSLAGTIPLTPIQQAFFALESPAPEQFTQTVLLDVQTPLVFEILRQAVERLVAHHDSLRLCYVRTDEGWMQRYQPGVASVQVTFENLSSEVAQQQGVTDTLIDLQQQLNLAEGDLLRAALFDLGDRQQLGIVIHHLAVDALSWLTLVKDLETIYRQLVVGEEVVLPLKTSLFKTWAEGLVQAELGKEERAYWENLPAPREDIAVGTSHAGRETRQLSQELTQVFLANSNRDRPQEKLLAALTLAVTQQFDQPSIKLDLEGHGREEDLVPGVRLVRTVGWFTSLFPVVLTAQADLAQTLQAVKTTLRAVPRHGVGYGILRYLGDESVRESLQAQLPARILFNYLGVLEQLLPTDSMFAMAEPLWVSRSDLQQRSHPIDISAFVFQGQLQINWDYSNVDPVTVKALADSTMMQLQQLIEGHSEDHSKVPAAEDFPLANLNSQKMDKLSALLGQLDGVED